MRLPSVSILLVLAGLLLPTRGFAEESGASRVGGPSHHEAHKEASPPGGRMAPPDLHLPAHLSLGESLELARTRGLDLLLADAAIRTANGDAETADAIENPKFSFMDGPSLNYSIAGHCSGCSRQNLTWTLEDQGSIVDVASGRRGLRKDVAKAALQAAKLSRVDAERALVQLVKQQYIEVAAATRTMAVTREILALLSKATDIARQRYPKVIDESDVARVEVEMLEAQQDLARVANDARQARLGLALLLGVRQTPDDFDVDDETLNFRVPARLSTLDESALVARALGRRPDLKVQEAQRVQAQAALALARRERMPTPSLGIMWNQFGYGQDAASIPILNASLSTDIPVLYQQQGEIRKAHADLATQSLEAAKAGAQVVADVANAVAAVQTNRELVQRMEGSLLERATLARGVVERQYLAGNTSLTDYLDAQRTYLSSNIVHIANLAAYWTAVYTLEAAVGEELSR